MRAASPPAIVAEPASGFPSAGWTGVRCVRRLVSGRGAGAGGDGGGAGSSGAIVEEPTSGFSISIVPPHFEQRVLTFGRSPSFDSSNLYLDRQAGQATIIATLLRSPGSARTRLPAPDDRGEDNTNQAVAAAGVE
jgi:hypothetical protein